jgi:hypothetical protein
MVFLGHVNWKFIMELLAFFMDWLATARAVLAHIFDRSHDATGLIAGPGDHPATLGSEAENCLSCEKTLT